MDASTSHEEGHGCQPLGPDFPRYEDPIDSLAAEIARAHHTNNQPPKLPAETLERVVAYYLDDLVKNDYLDKIPCPRCLRRIALVSRSFFTTCRRVVRERIEELQASGMTDQQWLLLRSSSYASELRDNQLYMSNANAESRYLWKYQEMSDALDGLNGTCVLTGRGRAAALARETEKGVSRGRKVVDAVKEVFRGELIATTQAAL